MDRRQVVRYAATTPDAARARAQADAAPAAAAGFEVASEPSWDARRRQPTLVVPYRWAPPTEVVRRVVAPQHVIAIRVARDAVTMGMAGYVLEDQVVVRNIRVGYPAPSTATLRYRYAPDIMGEPVGPISPPGRDRRDAWAPVRHLLPSERSLALPPPPDRIRAARRALLSAIGASRDAILNGERRAPRG